MWTPQRKRSLQRTHIHLFMLADARWLRRLQNAYLADFLISHAQVQKA